MEIHLFFLPNSVMNNQIINNNIRKNNEINEKETIEDVYPYILEDKKIIKFKRYDDTIKKVKIPISLRKNELYSTANYYKINKYADILFLSYNNLNLEKDESSINNIIDGAEIFIMEELKGIESNYYQNYLKKYNDKDLITILFYQNYCLSKSLRFSLNSTIKEMLKIYLFEMNIPEEYKNDYHFIYNSKTINNSSDLLKNIFNNNSQIKVIEKNILGTQAKKGKILEVTIKHNNNLLYNCNIGTLNQLKDFYLLMEKQINNFNKIQKIEVEKKNLKNEDENSTFSSLGIRKDFICNIKYINDDDKVISCCCIII